MTWLLAGLAFGIGAMIGGSIGVLLTAILVASRHADTARHRELMADAIQQSTGRSIDPVKADQAVDWHETTAN